MEAAESTLPSGKVGMNKTAWDRYMPMLTYCHATLSPAIVFLCVSMPYPCLHDAMLHSPNIALPCTQFACSPFNAYLVPH